MVQRELASYQLTFYFVFLLKSLPHVLYSKEVCKWFKAIEVVQCAPLNTISYLLPVYTSYQLLPLASYY